jgi:hypothetical protein
MGTARKYAHSEFRRVRIGKLTPILRLIVPLATMQAMRFGTERIPILTKFTSLVVALADYCRRDRLAHKQKRAAASRPLPVSIEYGVISGEAIANDLHGSNNLHAGVPNVEPPNNHFRRL